jgi:two-component system cell cycle sensor histidine kinase PleC
MMAVSIWPKKKSWLLLSLSLLGGGACFGFIGMLNRGFGQGSDSFSFVDMFPPIIVGAISGFIVACLFLKSRHRLLEQLRVETRYRDVFENARDGIFLIDPGTRMIVDVNRIGAERLGYRRDELVNAPLSTISLYARHERETGEWFSRIVTGEYPGPAERTHIHKDGSAIAIEASNAVVEQDGRKLIQSVARDITERKQAEAQIETIRSRFLDAIDGISDGIVLFDADDRFVMCNTEYRKVYAYAVSSLVPGTEFKELARVIAEHNRDELSVRTIDDYFQTIMKRHRNLEDGEIQDVFGRWLSFDHFRTKEGGILKIRKDITDQKLLEEQTKATQNRLLEAMENVSDGVVLWGPDERLVMCNSEFKKANAHLAGLLVPGLKFEEWARALAESSRIALAEGKVEEFIAERLQNHRGSGIVYDGLERGDRVVQLRRERLPDGSVIAFSTDVTERKLAEKNLRLRGLEIEVAEEGIFTFSSGGKILEINGTACRRLGYSRAELLNMSVADINPSYADGHWTQYFERAMKERHLVFEAVHLRKNGEVFPVEISTTYVAFEGSEYLCTFARYVTERKKYEALLLAEKERADEANRLKSEFLANMSHELRTPLNAILGFSDALKTGVFGELGNGKHQEYAENIHESGGHLLDLITGILDVSVIEAGKLRLHEEPTMLSNLAASSLRLVQQSADEGHVRLVNKINGDGGAIYADGRRVKQILVNLLTNAVKFTPEDGEVTIGAAHRQDGHFVISVNDTGLGMDKVGLVKAVEKFGQVENDLSPDQKGTGLGLPLSKSLIEAHGGALEIESEPGRGTTVRICFPESRIIQ